MTDETLEEAAENYINSKNPQWTPRHRRSFEDGAKWQADKMYSEEEVIEIAKDYAKRCQAPIQDTKWFEQFKKAV